MQFKDIPSGAPFSASTWGGRRNRADRTSDNLSLSQALNIIAASQYAAAIGLPFNRFLTIHWQHAGIPDEHAAWATGRFLKLARDWLAKRGQRMAWAWVRENGEGKGSHVHILLHLPPGASLGALQRRWLRLITDHPYRRHAIRTRRIGGMAAAAYSSPDAYGDNLRKAIAYILKGVAPDAAQALGLVRLEAGGRVIGKRAGTSENIGRKARSRSHRNGLSHSISRL